MKKHHKCSITDTPFVKIPSVCVVCGDEATEKIRYSQDNMPFILGIIARVSWVNVCFPYCQTHADRFRMRWTVLGFIQADLVIPGLLLVSVAGISQNQDIAYLLDWHLSKTVQMTMGMIGLTMIVLPVLTFLIKPFLYDAKVIRRGSSLIFRAPSEKFIAELSRMDGRTFPALDEEKKVNVLDSCHLN